MASWFRSWHGAPTDTKFNVIAKRAGVVPGVVSAVWWALLDHASQAEDRGSVADWDVETYAAWSGWDEGEVTAVVQAMKDKGLIDGDRIAHWDKRQPNDDTNKERQARWRERNKEGKDVTRYAPLRNDTETEPETEPEVEPERTPPPPPVDPYVALEFKANNAADAVVKAMVDPKYKEFVAIMDKHWGPRTISSATADDIAGWAKITPVEEWEYAIEQGRKHGKTNLRYVETILERVQRDGIPEGQGPVNAKEKGTEKVSGVVAGFKLSQLGM
jgi:hypothetical protein